MAGNRKSGILLPVFSLPSPYGAGSLGGDARRFIDFLTNAGQSYWQVLPLNPAGKGNSPYSSTSSFAGDPLFIDLDCLAEQGLLNKSEYADIDFGQNGPRIDYDKLAKRDEVLRLAFSRAPDSLCKSIRTFADGQPWFDDYALYTAIRTVTGVREWSKWDEGLKRRDPTAIASARDRMRGETDYIAFLQYEFFLQWNAIKSYANKNGVEIIGDLPIYCSLDSADVWAAPQWFELDDDLAPTEVSGCPPDFFNEDGQLWENPLYRWNALKADKYAWWMARLGAAVSMFDITRIDHFRGFAGYYAIPAGEATARNGRWRKGPGADFFRTANKALNNPRFIAEDLGYLTDDVRELRSDSGYPGMKVLQFAFNPNDESEYLPHRYEHNCVVYTGTHDNDTVVGWYKALPHNEQRYFDAYSAIKHRESPAHAMIRLAWASVADTAIAPMQDVLELDRSARINMPGVAFGNWGWQMKSGAYTGRTEKGLREVTRIYDRLPDRK